MKNISIESCLADTWFVEIISTSLSVVSPLVIVVILALYNGRLFFAWHKMTINTVVSIFATISRHRTWY